MAETMVASSVKSDHNSRKNKKPLMEKRRRARINSCLTQLKSLVLQAIKKDSSQFSKLEKADILELTVKHLRTLQRQQAVGVMSQDTNVVGKYRAGFNECAKEVVRYMGSVREVNEEVKERVVGHLANCLQVVNQMTPMESLQQHQQMKPLHVHIPAQQQQPINACVAAVAPPPSVIMHTAAVAPTSLPGYAHMSSPLRSSSSSPQDHQAPSSVSAAPLSTLPLQSAAMTTTATTVVSPAAASHISGAFKLVPSGAGAVAVYVGTSDTVPRGAPNTVSVDAVPLYSISLPPPHHTNPTLTAFVTPPPMSDSRYEDVSPVKMEYSSSNLSAASVPVDLRQTPRSKEECSPCRTLSSAGGHSSPALADKLWRPW